MEVYQGGRAGARMGSSPLTGSRTTALASSMTQMGCQVSWEQRYLLLHPLSQPHKPPASNQPLQLEIRWAQGKGSLMNIHLSKVSTGCICVDGIEGYISCSGGGKFSYGNAVFNLLIKLRLSARGSCVFLLQCQGEIYKFLKVI